MVHIVFSIHKMDSLIQAATEVIWIPSFVVHFFLLIFFLQLLCPLFSDLFYLFFLTSNLSYHASQ